MNLYLAQPDLRTRGACRRWGGYTLIEVLVVVSILGLVGAVVVPNILETGTLTIQGAARLMIADLLIAQNEAVAQQSPHRVVFDVASDSYRVVDDSGDPITVPWENGAANNYIRDFSADSRFAGIQISAVDLDEEQVEFDALGAPSSGGSINLTSGDTTYQITIAALTGRVTLAEVP